jgi:hypothetical protein
MKILKICLKVKHCEVNKESIDLHIANGTYNSGKLPKRGHNIHNKYLLLRE